MLDDRAKGTVADCIASTHPPLGFEEWRAGMSERVSRESGRKWCAVVDSSSHPDLPGQLWAFQESSEIWPLFMNTMMHEISLNGPIFIVFQPGGTIADWLLAQAESSPVGVLYAVAEGKENDLFEHLQNLLENPLPDAGIGLFRFYDPRVLHALTRFPDKTWTRLAVGPAESLHAWEPGRMTALELREGTLEILKECRSEPMPQELLDFMARHNAPYAVLHEASTLNPAVRLMDQALPKVFPFVEAACRSLEDLGIRGMRDMTAGAAFCLEAGANVFAIPSVVQWIKGAGRERPFLELLAGFSDELIRK